MGKKELFCVFILNIINMITGEYIFEPYVKIDEASSDEIYVGVSNNGNNGGESTWRIKRMIKTGGVWSVEFPDGNQEFIYKWDDRYTFGYK